MKKLLNILLILTSLVGYLEWGNGQRMFLFRMEYDLLFGGSGNSDSFLHPFVLIPLVGQLLLLITVFQKRPRKWLTYTGLICLSLLLLFISFIGILGLNWKIFLSTVPFIVTAVLVLRANRGRTWTSQPFS